MLIIIAKIVLILVGGGAGAIGGSLMEGSKVERTAAEMAFVIALIILLLGAFL